MVNFGKFNTAIVIAYQMKELIMMNVDDSNEEEKHSIRLAFSGGGFRATFYCLGAYRRLVEMGIHRHVTHISSVSGGSITAAVIMTELAGGEFQSIADFDQRVTQPLVKIGQQNLRKQIILRGLKRLKFESLRTRFSSVFPELLDENIFDGMLMSDLPGKPEWSCNATCLNTLKRFRFKSTDIYGNLLGTTYDLSGITVSFAVAASAAFPMMFAPLSFNTVDRTFHDNYGESAYNSMPELLLLADGGVYDNLGSESSLRSNECFIVIDASSKIIPWEKSFRPNYFQKIWRNLEVSMEQIVLLRRRLIYQNNNTVQLLIDRPLSKIMEIDLRGCECLKNIPGYRIKHDVEYAELIGNLRTDLDAFHDVEIDMLMWSGAIRMDMAVKTLCQSLVPKSMLGNMPDCPSINFDIARKILERGSKRRNWNNVHDQLKS